MSFLGMDFDAFHEHTMSPVSKAASKGDVDELRHLLDAGRAADVRDNKGWIALHHAAAANAVDALKVLLEHDSSLINAESFEGETPLIAAAQNGAFLVVRELVRHEQIDVNKVNNEGVAALEFAINYALRLVKKSTWLNYQSFERYWDLDSASRLAPVKDLLENGAHANDRKNRPHLHTVVRCSEGLAPKVIELLLPHTVYDRAKERKETFSPMQTAIVENVHKVEVFLKFINQSEFVVPNREYVRHWVFAESENERFVLSNLSLLIVACDASQNKVLRMVTKMVEEGWDVNAVGDSFSPLAAAAVAGKNYHLNEDFDSNPLLDFLISKGACMKRTEARFVVKAIMSGRDFAPYLVELINNGTISPETLLNARSTIPPGFEEIRKAFVSLRLFQILAINEVFGNQGGHANKIKKFMEDYTKCHGRRNHVAKMAVVKEELEMGSLKMQARTVVRQSLRSQGFLHPWQMRSPLESCIPLGSLVDFVINIKVPNFLQMVQNEAHRSSRVDT